MYYINSNDKTKIAVFDLNPKGKQSIVLIHGWPLSHKMFEYQLPALLSANYRIIMLDLRGFGDSQETADGYTYNQFATDLYYIVSSLGLYNFILLGFSMGGAIATRYMRLYNGYGVSKLCLLDSAVPSYCKTLENPYGQTLESTNQLIDLAFNDRPSLNQYFGSIFFAKTPSVAFKNWFQDLSNTSSGLGEMKSLISLRDENVFDDLKKISVPTGIFHGKEDKICPFGMARIMNQEISNSVLFPLNNAGHGAFYDVKDIFNDALINFLDKS